MNKNEALTFFQQQVDALAEKGNYKNERVLTSPQSSRVNTPENAGLINLCANNYLGLCDDPAVIEAARQSYEKWGFGLSSVRFICGTTQVHKQLEAKLSAFLGTEDTLLYSSCFDANGGLFECLLGDTDAVISDALNHASIIDGIRLCKARRFRYQNNDMPDLEKCLQQAQGTRIRLIVTDGVFSMDGTIANLPGICRLAEKYDALVMVDDSHSVGFMGKNGRGTHEYWDMMGKVDIITGTLGKALGGASGGYTSSRREIVELLRQKSRPYLFSNTLAPAIAEASLQVLTLLETSDEKRARLWENTAYFRAGIERLGYDILPGEHPIVAIMLYEAKTAKEMAAALLERGVYVTAFSFPVVPEGKARIRVQLTAAHTREDLDAALKAFAAVKPV